MNSWTDIGLIIAIVVGLISAASLPMVSVNAVSAESLRLRQATHGESAPWALVSQGKLETWTASPSLNMEAAAAGLKAINVDAASAGLKVIEAGRLSASTP